VKAVIKSKLGYLTALHITPGLAQPLFTKDKKKALVFRKQGVLDGVMQIFRAPENSAVWAHLKFEAITLVNFELRWKQHPSHGAVTGFKNCRAAQTRAEKYGRAAEWQIVKVPA